MAGGTSVHPAQPVPLLAAILCGVLIGTERGWQQRNQADGTRVAGIRTFTLVGGAGGLTAAVAVTLSEWVAAAVAIGLVALLLSAFLRTSNSPNQRDATTMVAAIVTFLLGLLAGAGQVQVGIGGAALITLILASRRPAHRLLRALSRGELYAFAFFAVISLAVLPFLPNRDLGPYSAWNPFRLWLVVVLIIAFSMLGHIANRVFGENKGTIATALIGGAYSSTAVTASFSAQLGAGGPGPLSTGIALASAVMYVRVLALTAILAPVAAPHLAVVLGFPAIMAGCAAAFLWRRERHRRVEASKRDGTPFQFFPALVFAAVVAAASLLVRWAQSGFGEAGAAVSLFIAGTFDVDAAIVAFSALPRGTIATDLAAVVLGATVGVNMALKIGVVFANAGARKGAPAAFALMSSAVLLLITLAWGFAGLT